jgi:glycosyltransferase involved in cell wall biosynthesis
MKKILFVCQVFYPNTQSTSQLFGDLLGPLARRGYDISVLAGFSDEGSGSRTSASENWNGVLIRRGGSRTHFKKSMARRALAYLSYMLFVGRVLLTSPRGSRVFVVTNPPFAPLLVWIVCALRRFHWTVMLLDLFPEGLTAVGKIPSAGPVDRLWRFANRRALRAADDVWVLGRDMGRLIRENYEVPPDRVRYVPHWSSIAVTEARRAEETRQWRRLGLDGKFVVQYSGNMGLWHDIDTIVRAAALVGGSASVHFLFIGSGIKRAAAEKLAGELGLKNVTWLPYQNREDLDDSLACCHAALISQKEGLEGVAVPCKLYGILASARAVVAQVPDASEAAQVVREEECGVVVRPNDPKALADAVMALACDPELTAAMGSRAFAAYRAKYTLEKAVETFDQAWRGWLSAE